MPRVSDAARRRNNETKKEMYRWYKAHGICPACGRVYAEPGTIYCATCYRKIKARRAQLDPGSEMRKLYNRNRKADLIARGLCTWCGKRPPIEGQRLCRACREKDKQSKEKYIIRQRIQREADAARARTREAIE